MTTPQPPIPLDSLVDDDPPEAHDRGLLADLQTLATRRSALGLVGAAGLLALAACSGESADRSTAASATPTTPVATTDSSDAADVGEVPDETAGPYPGDGSNGKDVLTAAGVVRTDITTSIGSDTLVEGIPMTVNLTVTDSANGYAPLAGAAVYLWQCDAEGRYSMYSQGVESETFLRGVAATDASGTVTFGSIFPGCYAGRWPHLHFQVFPSVDVATSTADEIKVSQVALPQAAAEAVYADSRYPQSTRNLSQVSLATDNVFRDDQAIRQLATVTGDNSSGYVASLTVGI